MSKSFRGFRVKPSDRGMSFITSSEDVEFEGRTDNFEFIVVAKNYIEAKQFADHALGEISFELSEVTHWK